MADVIVLPRRGGKTEKMIEWLLAAAIEAPDEHRIVVSHSLAESHRVMRLVYERGFLDASRINNAESWQFVSVGEVMEREEGLWHGVKMRDIAERTRREFTLGVDNADLVLEQLLHHRVGAISVTGSDER